MIRFIYTHVYNCIQKIIVAVAAFCLFYYSLKFCSSWKGLRQLLFIIVMIVITFKIVKPLNWLLTPVSTELFLYTNYKLKMSYHEARIVSFLFDGSLDGTWYRMATLEDIPEEERKKILFDFAEQFLADNTES